MIYYVVRLNDIIFHGTYEECENYIENYCKVRYTDDLLAGQIYIIDDDELSDALLKHSHTELTEEDIPFEDIPF